MGRKKDKLPSVLVRLCQTVDGSGVTGSDSCWHEKDLLLLWHSIFRKGPLGPEADPDKTAVDLIADVLGLGGQNPTTLCEVCATVDCLDMNYLLYIAARAFSGSNEEQRKWVFEISHALHMCSDGRPGYFATYDSIHRHL